MVSMAAVGCGLEDAMVGPGLEDAVLGLSLEHLWLAVAELSQSPTKASLAHNHMSWSFGDHTQGMCSF